LTTLGVFDSGVGGLSVLRDLRQQMPGVHCVYVADNAFAPYGERDVASIRNRASRVTGYLRASHHIDALVIACNTATAHAVEGLRAAHPDLPIIGVEPALKPAALLSQTGSIGVLATRATLQSERFSRLSAQVAEQRASPTRFISQPCDGLADAIERHDTEAIHALTQRYLDALWSASPSHAGIDTIVLGCTHYPFALSALKGHCKADVRWLDTGLPVAKRAQAVLLQAGHDLSAHPATAPPSFVTTGDLATLNRAVERWLGLEARALHGCA
jgi:glutamate racemase